MSADDDFNKILFADSVLDLLAAKVVERLAATGGGQDKAAGVQVKVESGQGLGECEGGSCSAGAE